MPDSADGRLVTLVVLSFNKRAYTEQCLGSLITSTYRPIEVIVVDQGSNDGSREAIEALGPTLADAGIELRPVLNAENVGAPAGRNQGMDLARGEFIGFLDNDIAVKSAGWLEALTQFLDAHPKVGVISPKLVFPGNQRLIEFAGCGVSPSGRIQYIGRGESADDPRFGVPREVQCLISACILMPIAAQRAAGHMDIAYSPVQYEDLDYCYRLKELGYTCWVLPEVEMYHYEHITTAGSASINFRYVTIRNGLRFKQRWQHAFSQENGPRDEDTTWKEIERYRLPSADEAGEGCGTED